MLVVALAASPARADTAGPATTPTDATGPMGYSQPAPTAPQSNTATNTQSATATGGAGGSATGGNAGPSQAGGASQGGNAYANGGRAESQNSLQNKQSGNSGRDGSGSGSSRSGGKESDGEYTFVSDGQNTYVVESTKRRSSHREAARTNHARSRGDTKSGAAGRAIPRQTNERGGPETGKSLPSGAGQPGNGGQLPSQSPFFSLLSGSGGAGTGPLLLLLAVLGAAITLPNHHFKAFRTPAAPWRPSAYVSPIELPG